MPRPVLFAVPLALGLAACSGWLPPFETVPPAAPAGQSDVTRVAVCYNWLTATKDRVRDVAAQSCGAGSKADRVDRDVTLDYCPILTPARATFACTAP